MSYVYESKAKSLAINSSLLLCIRCQLHYQGAVGMLLFTSTRAQVTKLPQQIW